MNKHISREITSNQPMRESAEGVSRRTFLALGGTASMAGLLAACSSGGSTGGGTSSKKIAGQTITVWDPNYTKPTTAPDALDAAFKAKTGVTVKRVPEPQVDQYAQLLEAAFAGHSGPDVMLMYPGAQGVLRFKQGLLELSDQVASVRSQLKYWESASPTYSETGPVYGVPIGTAGVVFYYNKKLFMQAGLDPAKPPATLDELISAGQALKAKGIQPFASGDKEGFENQWYFSAMWAGANPVSASVALAKNQLKMTDPRIKAAFASYMRLQDAQLFPADRFSQSLFPNGDEAFKTGKAGMFLGLTDVVDYWAVYDAALGADTVGYFQAPGIGAAQAPQLPVTPSYVWSVPVFAAHQDAAVEFVKFTGSTQAQQILYEKGKNFPNNFQTKLTDAPPQLTGMVADFRTRPTFITAHQLVPGTVLTALSTEINQVLQNRESFDTALTHLQSTFETAVQ